MADSPASRVTLARILRARGRRGEVAAQILTDFPERFPKLTSAKCGMARILRAAWEFANAGCITARRFFFSKARIQFPMPNVLSVLKFKFRFLNACPLRRAATSSLI